MKSTEIADSMVKLVNNPVKISLWFEILRNPGITAKELQQKLRMKGTAIYYHLQQLEESRLIQIQTKQVRNFIQKEYHISEEFVEDKETGALKIMAEKYPREVALFELYLMASMINKQIQRLTKDQEEDLDIEREDSFGELLLIDERLVGKIREKYEEIKTLMRAQARDASFQELSQQASHGVIIGCYSLD
ncbi:MAG: winged helix-turn-helix transcriptional regulator [Candidatus Hermodarchaeota archaeon]